MNQNRPRSGDDAFDDVVSALCGLIGRCVISCAATLCWTIVSVVLVKWVPSDWCWYAIVIYLVLLVTCVGIAAVPWPCRARDVARFILPVMGDVLRWRRRRARRLGNEWLRDTRLVTDADDRRPVSHPVFLWPDRIEIQRLRVVGVTEERIRAAVTASLARLDMADYRLTRTGNSAWVIDLYTRDRIDVLREPRVLRDIVPARARVGHLYVPVGRDLDGDAWQDLADLSGALLSGLPGSGKSSGMNELAVALLARPDLAEVHVLDGKGSGDWRWAQGRAAGYVATSGYDEALRLLRLLHGRMMARLTDAAGSEDPNMWHGFGVSHPDRAIVLFIDEVQTWTDPPQMSKESKEGRDEFLSLVTDLIRRGRSAMIVVVLATQRPVATVIPTSLRDICGLRICLRVRTTDSARAALGDLVDGDPSPCDIPPDATGMGVMTTDTGHVKVIRFDYLPPDALRAFGRPKTEH
ncbi:hypothetical protein JS533_001505 [Bifidobacterium amazonense]|uniref:FtsK domain-containing protein n=1 Tax=Bifidobacterium amazonense TaxID=2809027 RepID=A0ABS9VSA4_9BIFI|nr:hypothetical protein [Bifidobacterium amazonense]MCH9274965.1 hypothetical protein [Bifidobacterium amazonense]